MHLLFAWLFLSWAFDLSVDCSDLRQNVKWRRRARSLANDDSDSECLPSDNCVPICCPEGVYTRGYECQEDVESPASDLEFPEIYTSDLERLPDSVNWTYTGVYGYPCEWGSYALSPDEYQADEFYLLENGEIYLPQFMNGTAFGVRDYCFASVRTENGSDTVVAVCFKDVSDRIPIIYPIAMVLSTPFLVATFVVYSVIPDLHNIHGYTLRAYVAILFVSYIAMAAVQLGDQSLIELHCLCMTLAYIIHFSFLASFFWLNVMCFDIWWTFGGFRSLQGSVKQRERKKFIIYSIYAWGWATVLSAICMIMDLAPGIPETLLRPEFGVESCWFKTDSAKALYFYGPMGVTILCNIFLFISTAVKIIRHKKDTAHHLKGTDSRRHDDNKQWFNLYLKLFIVMGINWSMEIISWLCRGPKELWYVTDLGNTLQGLIIFIIFVWKEKIKRLLLKRFGFQGPNFLSRDSTRSAYHSSTSRTCVTSVPLHEKTSTFPDPVSRARNTSDDSDGV